MLHSHCKRKINFKTSLPNRDLSLTQTSSYCIYSARVYNDRLIQRNVYIVMCVFSSMDELYSSETVYCLYIVRRATWCVEWCSSAIHSTTKHHIWMRVITYGISRQWSQRVFHCILEDIILQVIWRILWISRRSRILFFFFIFPNTSICI